MQATASTVSTASIDKPQVAKPQAAKPSGGKLKKFILPAIVLGAIGVCTRVHLGFNGANRETIKIEITSKIGKENKGIVNFKNSISLNLHNPLNTTSLNHAKKVLSGKEEIKGEFLGRKISIAPKKKVKPSSVKSGKKR
jgi:hypothetical protein